MGWNVGLNTGGIWHGLLGLFVILGAMVLPSSVLTVAVTRWLHRHRDKRIVRSFKQGMAPIVVALLLATAWILASANSDPATDWPIWVVTVVTALMVWRTRLHILWLLAGGAALGWFHLI
jgi:chromate transporter